jgi:hypothetical protein
MDDDIYEHLKKDFPDFDPAATIDEDKMKSKQGKERWRNFMMAYEKKIDDYNFGTMLRNSAKEEYTQDGTIFGEKCRLNTGCFHVNNLSKQSRECSSMLSKSQGKITTTICSYLFERASFNFILGQAC